MYLITWITTHLPTPEGEGWMAELALLAYRQQDRESSLVKDQRSTTVLKLAFIMKGLLDNC